MYINIHNIGEHIRLVFHNIAFLPTREAKAFESLVMDYLTKSLGAAMVEKSDVSVAFDSELCDQSSKDIHYHAYLSRELRPGTNDLKGYELNIASSGFLVHKQFYRRNDIGYPYPKEVPAFTDVSKVERPIDEAAEGIVAYMKAHDGGHLVSNESVVEAAVVRVKEVHVCYSGTQEYSRMDDAVVALVHHMRREGIPTKLTLGDEPDVDDDSIVLRVEYYPDIRNVTLRMRQGREYNVAEATVPERMGDLNARCTLPGTTPYENPLKRCYQKLHDRLLQLKRPTASTVGKAIPVVLYHKLDGVSSDTVRMFASYLTISGMFVKAIVPTETIPTIAEHVKDDTVYSLFVQCTALDVELLLFRGACQRWMRMSLRSDHRGKKSAIDALLELGPSFVRDIQSDAEDAPLPERKDAIPVEELLKTNKVYLREVNGDWVASFAGFTATSVSPRLALCNLGSSFTDMLRGTLDRGAWLMLVALTEPRRSTRIDEEQSKYFRDALEGRHIQFEYKRRVDGDMWYAYLEGDTVYDVIEPTIVGCLNSMQLRGNVEHGESFTIMGQDKTLRDMVGRRISERRREYLTPAQMARIMELGRTVRPGSTAELAVLCSEQCRRTYVVFPHVWIESCPDSELPDSSLLKKKKGGCVMKIRAELVVAYNGKIVWREECHDYGYVPESRQGDIMDTTTPWDTPGVTWKEHTDKTPHGEVALRYPGRKAIDQFLKEFHLDAPDSAV